MSVKIITAALVAAILASFSTISAASAQTYGGAPACGYGRTWDAANYRCVPVAPRHDHWHH